MTNDETLPAHMRSTLAEQLGEIFEAVLSTQKQVEALGLKLSEQGDRRTELLRLVQSRFATLNDEQQDFQKRLETLERPEGQSRHQLDPCGHCNEGTKAVGSQLVRQFLDDTDDELQEASNKCFGGE